LHSYHVERECRVSERIKEQFARSRRESWKRPCSVCGTATIRLDGLCYRHKSARVRNGHEEQRAIKLPLIRFYADKVGGFITADDISALVTAIETVKRQADDYLATHTDPQHRSRNAQGQPYTTRDRVHYAARREIANAIGNLRDVRLAVKLVVGMTVLQEMAPELIKSDDAFLFQIARAVRRAGKPMAKGVKTPVPTRKGVMPEAGRLVWEAVARVTMKLAREVKLRDQREHAQKMLERDAEEAAWAEKAETERQQRNPDDDWYIDAETGKPMRRAGGPGEDRNGNGDGTERQAG
jgi:hypothetical protein